MSGGPCRGGARPGTTGELMYVIVAGCGRVGSRIAEYLSYDRHDVVVIDSDPRSFRRLGKTFNGITLEGLSFDEEVLLEAGIEKADAFTAVTNKDNTNLMASEIARSIFKVPLVLSRLYNPGQEHTYFRLGLDYVCGTTLITERILERMFQSEESVVQQDRPDLGIQIIEFGVGTEAEGKPAGSLNYGVSSKLLLLARETQQIPFDDLTPLRSGDRVVMLLRREGWKTVSDCLGPGVDSTSCRMYTIPDELAAEATAPSVPERACVVVGGCSMVGANLAYRLSMEEHAVVIVDEDPSLFRRLPEKYTGEFLEGVIYDQETLIAAGIEQADAFVSVTKKDNKNLMAAEVARHIFEVPHVMARMFNPDKELTYQALQMPYVCGTTAIAQVMLERLLDPAIRVKAACLYNKFNLVEFQCPTAWDGRTIGRAVEDISLTFAYVVRRTSAYVPEDSFVLRKGDLISVLVTTRRLPRLERSLRKMKKG